MRRAPLCLLLVLSLGTAACSSGGGGSGGDGGGGGGGSSGPDSLRVDVTPDDAQIVVRDSDDRIVSLPDDGQQIDLDAGRYTVEVHKVRFQSSTRQVQVAGETTVDVRLTAETSVQPMRCGPLHVSAANPRYFADNCGTLYLAGLHTWNNLIDMGTTSPPRLFDFDAFARFLQDRGVNAIRLWAWETPHPDDTETAKRDFTAPQPWLRTGPGLAVDGLPDFDLGAPNEAYFVRMRERVRTLQDDGVYVIVMLFDGWSVQWSPGAASDPYGRENNANGIDHGGLRRIDTLSVPAIVNVQEAYVRKVLDTLSDLDNVMYEIANEAVSESVDWQYHMIDLVKRSTSRPVGMSWPWGASNSVLFNSAADWVSPSGGLDPAPATGDKVIVFDNDHLGGSQSGDQIWVWKSFTRGVNPLFMDCYEPPDGLCANSYAPAGEVRRALGATLRYAERMNLAAAVPRGDLASSGYCLASNTELAVFVPGGGGVDVNVPASSSSFHAEWYDPSQNQVHSLPSVSSGLRHFDPPFGGPAVLFLWIP